MSRSATERHTQRALRNAPVLCSDVSSGLREILQDYSARLASTRGLRAWQLMLLLNKFYRLLFRESWHGRIECFRWLLRIPIDGIGDLGAEEPVVVDEGRLRDLSVLVNASIFNLNTNPLFDGSVSRRDCGSAQRIDIVVFPVFEYDFRFQRPQHLALQFARSGSRVWWLSPRRRPSPGEPYEIERIEEGLWELRVDVDLPNIYSHALTIEGAAPLVRRLRQFLRDSNAGSVLAFVQFPYWADAALSLGAKWCSRIIYDCMDDWENFPDVGDSVRRQHRRMIENSDVVVVSSEHLLERCEAAGVQPILARNAVDFDFFSTNTNAMRLNVPRPIIGYFGAIADWFDFELVRGLAEARPDYSILLIGGFGLELVLAGPQAHRLKNIPNITLLGHKPYNELPDYLSLFDVCIIPFLENDVTHATDPVKIYEYFSQGKPVVATPMNELKRLGDLVYTARGVHQFCDAIDEALAEEGHSLREDRIRFSRENDWSNRHKTIDAAITATFERVSIIIVTYNSEAFLSECLRSLLRSTEYPNYEVIIVDNDSSDNSLRIAGEFAAADQRIRVLKQSRNCGFSGANNIGVEASAGDWLVLLNPDTVLTSGWLSGLIRHSRNDETLGLLVPVTNSAGNEALIECRYESFRGMTKLAEELSREERDKEYPLDVAPLFCTLISRKVWDKVGPLDVEFKVGMFEDDDYSVRIRRHGLRIAAAEDVFVHHFGGGSFKALDDMFHQSVFQENRDRFEQKWGVRWRPHQYRPGIDKPNLAIAPERFHAGENSGP